MVTPGSIVSFTVKLRLAPPGRAELSDEVVLNDQKNLGRVEAGAESTIDELIGRRKAGEDGEEPTPLAHAPEFIKVTLSLVSDRTRADRDAAEPKTDLVHFRRRS